MRKALQSPLLLVVLLLSTAGLASALFTRNSARRAPDLPGYSWAKHPNALLVVYPMADACSTCSLSVYGWAVKGRGHGLDVVVAAHKETLELRSLLKEAMPNVTVVTGASPEFIGRFSRGDKIGGVLVVDGRVVRRQIGGTPDEGFFGRGR